MGGLGNRMRLIASGLWLQQLFPGRMIGFWEPNHVLNCPYHLLFENIDGLEMLPKNKKYRFVSSSNQHSFIKKQVANSINKLLGVDYCLEEKDFFNLIWPGKLDIVEVKRDHQRIYFKTFEGFGDNEAEFKKLKPVAELQHIINDVTAGFTPATIGVQIRRTDHLVSIENSPSELFVANMKAEMEADENTRFFLCTDDVQVENELKNIFGNRIITYPKELSRQTEQGIKDAVVDMYCLSVTKKIYGSFRSSFSEGASSINGVPLIRVKK